MTKEIRIYVEGGGDSQASRAAIRVGFGEFLRDLRKRASSKGIRWSITACGSRNSTFDDFKTALKTHPEAFNVLLVDSEEAVTTNPWRHLAQRQGDSWSKPEGVTDEHCHLMVQTMETWLIADIEALARFYRQHFHSNAIPKNQNVEVIDKITVSLALENATRHTQPGKYHKIQHAPKLLTLVDVERVCLAAPHCARLFSTLLAKINNE